MSVWSEKRGRWREKGRVRVRIRGDDDDDDDRDDDDDDVDDDDDDDCIYKLCHVSPDKKSLNASAKSPLHISFLVWSSGGYILRKFPCRTKIYKNVVLLPSPYPTSRKDWVTERNVKLSWNSYGGHVRKFKLDVSATKDELSSWSDRHY